MPRITGAGSKRLRVTVLVVILALAVAFTPVSRALLSAIDGSFAPIHYTSLAFVHPARVTRGVTAGTPVRMELANHLGHRETYQLHVTQSGSLISLGTETLGSGQAEVVSIPTLGARRGTLEVPDHRHRYLSHRANQVIVSFRCPGARGAARYRSADRSFGTRERTVKRMLGQW